MKEINVEGLFGALGAAKSGDTVRLKDHEIKPIVDVWPEYHEERNEIDVVIETTDGLTTIASVQPKSRPTFADAKTDEDMDCSDYNEWYDMALEEAHKQNYFLEGELGR